MRSTEPFPTKKVNQILGLFPDVGTEKKRLASMQLKEIWAGERRGSQRRDSEKTSLRHGRDGVMDTSAGRRLQTRRDNPNYVEPESDDPAGLAVV